MIWLLKAWLWLKKNWKWVLFPIGIIAFIGGFLLRRRAPKVVAPELAGADVVKEKLLVELEDEVKIVEKDKVAKLEKIDKEHAATVKKLTDDQKAEAQGLRTDPEKLQEFLLGVGKDVRGG